MKAKVTVNGVESETELPSTLESFVRSQGLLPRSVVIEHNGEAVAPSEFGSRPIRAGDRLEIVRIVAGG
jgi:thiamine biosynthesis protein ThiS